MNQQTATEHIRHEIFRRFGNSHGVYARCARAWGVSPEYLRKVLAYERPPSDRILEKVGMRKRTVYEINNTGD